MHGLDGLARSTRGQLRLAEHTLRGRDPPSLHGDQYVAVYINTYLFINWGGGSWVLPRLVRRVVGRPVRRVVGRVVGSPPPPGSERGCGVGV